MQEHSAGIILVNEGKYLLLHYEEGHWGFPKGHLEPGEEPKEAAIRELEEETGIRTFSFLTFHEQLRYGFMREREKVKKLVDFFLATTTTMHVTLSPEHIGYTWLPFEEAFEKLTFRGSKEILQKAQETAKNED